MITPTINQAIIAHESVEQLMHKGSVAHEHDHIPEALQYFMQAAQQKPNDTNIANNCAYLLKKLRRFDEAIHWYKKVLAQNPQNPGANLGIGYAYLAQGDFVNGWQQFEWRWSEPPAFNRAFKQYLDNGGSLTNKIVFLITEFGLGDTIQFIRYAHYLKQQGAVVIVACQKPLMPLLSLCPFIDRVIPQNFEPQSYDFQATVMSLPWILNNQLTTIPNKTPYLQAAPNLVECWANKVADDNNLKIGICWQADVHKESTIAAVQRDAQKKSIALAELTQFATMQGISLYSLQKINGLEQLQTAPHANLVKTFTEDFDESHGRFMDTAALICNLDLIITIDTSIAHLAGALGKPVWLLLPYNADWRWLENNKKDSPWYPTMRLFWQQQEGDWSTVIEEIKKELRS